MGTDNDAYDDGLQAWLTGNPGWPGWPAPRAAATSLDVAVVRDTRSRLHERARELATQADACAAAGDEQGAHRSDLLLSAVLQELTA